MLLSVETISEISKTFQHSGTGREISHHCGRYLLERIYQQHISQTMPPISRSQTGKPYFPTEPYHFNISHSGQVVAVALSTQSVGFDVQLVKSPSLSLIRRVCSAEEQAWLARLPKERQPLGFTALWTGKEAIQKESGEGIGSGRTLSAISIPYTSNDTIFSQSYTDNIFLHRRLGTNYCLALACREEIDPKILEEISLP